MPEYRIRKKNQGNIEKSQIKYKYMHFKVLKRSENWLRMHLNSSFTSLSQVIMNILSVFQRMQVSAPFRYRFPP